MNPTGLRKVFRWILLEQAKKRSVYKNARLEVEEGETAKYLPRVNHIVKLESMVNVGCKFQPDDLSASQWHDLIMLAQERQWVQEHLDEEVRPGSSITTNFDTGLSSDEMLAQAKARAEAGLPGPGQSIFDRMK